MNNCNLTLADTHTGSPTNVHSHWLTVDHCSTLFFAQARGCSKKDTIFSDSQAMTNPT